MPVVALSGPPGISRSNDADALAALHPAVRRSIDDVEEAMRGCGIADTEPWGPEVLRLDAARPADELARSVLAQVASSGSSDSAS